MRGGLWRAKHRGRGGDGLGVWGWGTLEGGCCCWCVCVWFWGGGVSKIQSHCQAHGTPPICSVRVHVTDVDTCVHDRRPYDHSLSHTRARMHVDTHTSPLSVHVPCCALKLRLRNESGGCLRHRSLITNKLKKNGF